MELDGLAPRLQVGLRYTATGSHLPDDMIIWPVNFAQARDNQGGKRMEAIGIRLVVGLYFAISKGSITLTSTDPSVQPYLDFHLLEEAFDRERAREGVRLAVEIAKDPEFESIIESRITPLDVDLLSDDALDEWLLREVSTGLHLTTTCRMGPKSDPMNVVDQFGKVHGLEGVRIADASVMPDCVRANTNVTTMMIGERIAEFMKAI